MCSLGSPEMIQGVKDDPVLQVSCQEPYTSSKYPHQGPGVLDTLLIMIECWNFAHRLGIKCQEQWWGKRWPISSMSPVRNPQYPPSHWWWQGSSWHISNNARMLKFGTQVVNPMSRTIIRSKLTHVLHVSGQEPSMSSKSLKIIWWFLTHF